MKEVRFNFLEYSESNFLYIFQHIMKKVFHSMYLYHKVIFVKHFQNWGQRSLNIRLNKVCTIGWIKSLIMIATYQLYICLAKSYFASDVPDSTSFIIDVCYLCLFGHQSAILMMASSNPTPSIFSPKCNSFDWNKTVVIKDP